MANRSRGAAHPAREGTLAKSSSVEAGLITPLQATTREQKAAVTPAPGVNIGDLPLEGLARGITADGTQTPNIQVVQCGSVCWVDIKHPGKAEIAWLHTHYPNFHPLHFSDVMSFRQRSKIDERPDYLFMVLHFPLHDKASRLSTPCEVDIFVGPGYVITAHTGQLRPLMGLFDQARDIPGTCAAMMGRGSGYLLYTIIELLIDYCFPLLTRTDEDIERLEHQVFANDARRTVLDISMVRREVIAFRHVIKPQIGVITTLERRAAALSALMGEDFTEYFSNLNDHLGKIWDTLEDYKDVIEGLSDTYNSLTNTHINNIIKVLTLFSVLVLPMTLLASVYGMNFDVIPLTKDPNGFWITVAVMVFVAVSMLIYFRRRGWV
jgi:magnesium transporter